MPFCINCRHYDDTWSEPCCERPGNIKTSLVTGERGSYTSCHHDRTDAPGHCGVAWVFYEGKRTVTDGADNDPT